MRLTIIVMAIAMSTMGWADTFTSVSSADAYITVQETATLNASLDYAGGELVAGDWSEGTPAAMLTVSVLQGSSTQRPATRWTPAYPKQSTVNGCDACRDITAAAGVGVMHLKLACTNATMDTANGGWQYATTGSSLSCTIATAQQATVVAGNYTLSLDAAMRTD
jgi:hypothetical protein